MIRERLTWEAPEYTYIEKDPNWFWSVGIVGIAAAVAAVIFSNVLFAALIFLGTIALLLQSLKHPHVRTYSIDRRGIAIDTSVYPYTTLDTFWLEDEPSYKLLIKSQKLFMPLIIIPLPHDIEADELHELLLEQLPEEELHEPFLEHIMEYLGF